MKKQTEMRKIKGASTLILGLFLSLNCNAQEKATLNQLQATPPTTIQKPILLDSIDLKGVAFKEGQLLNNQMVKPAASSFNTKLENSGDNLFVLPKAGDNGEAYNIQLLRFQLESSKYSKQNIKIKTAALFELYVDGVKELTKSSSDSTFTSAKEQSKSIQLLPGWTKEFTIKLIRNEAFENDSIQIEIEDQSKKEEIDLLATTENKRLTNILDVMTGNKVNDATVSPNGEYALLTYLSTAKGGKSQYYSELIEIKSNKTTYLGSIFPSWLPKSNAYYQTISKGERLELIKTDPATGAVEVIAEDIPKGSFRFTPDEKALLYTEKEEGIKQSGDLKALGSPNNRINGYYDRYYIHYYDLETGIKSRLTYGENSTSIQDISADSRYLLFSVSEEQITKRPFRTNHLYLLELSTQKLDTIWYDEPFAYGAKFSPSGKELLITGAPEAFNGIGLNIKADQIANSYDTQAYIMDLATKKVNPITKEFNPSINSAVWNKNDNLIYFNTVDKDCQNIYTYDTKKERYSKLNLEESVIRSFNLANNNTMAVYTGTGLFNSNKTYSYDLKRDRSKLLSDPTKERFDNLQLGKVETWNFTASDGTTIEGRYYLPPHFDASKKYPMIVYYYSGTTPTDQAFEHPYSMHVYAAMGYVVYTLQPSGTIGFGQEFSARHVNGWGKRTADDIIEGTTKFADDHSFVNKDKIGCMGASYGGFMTMYLQTQTDLFTAAVSHAGISSLSSYWGEGYWGFSYSSGASAHSYPWNNKELYVEQSPLFHADKINTPILLLHGTVDTNVPIGESIQMYTALKILGKPVEFIQVKDENHGIAKYDRRLQWNYSIYSWFERWLKEDNEWWNTLYPNRKAEK